MRRVYRLPKKLHGNRVACINCLWRGLTVAVLRLCRRGLSKFFNGKAKSFSSLANVSSIEELAKPENPYARRRRTTIGDRHKSFPPLSGTSTTGISKRPPSHSGSRGGLAMAVAMGSKHGHEPIRLPSPYSYSIRSRSLTDLVHATSDTC